MDPDSWNNFIVANPVRIFYKYMPLTIRVCPFIYRAMRCYLLGCPGVVLLLLMSIKWEYIELNHCSSGYDILYRCIPLLMIFWCNDILISRRLLVYVVNKKDKGQDDRENEVGSKNRLKSSVGCVIHTVMYHDVCGS